MAKPLYRFLRGYTLDPGFSTQLDTTAYNETTYRVRWEELTREIPIGNNKTRKVPQPGPCGEYFEVIDIDPSSNCCYDPVDLDDDEVLSQHGLKPSEGNPKFHQQFVYTIAMKVLEQFEQALGRRLVWDPRYVAQGKPYEYVPTIRLYPHALRQANAYYTSEKKAILFGYFKAARQVQGINFPGGAIFTCLSPDIIAHEVTHALVDCIHHRFLENTNIDVPAFHEGFADIIALLQRFTVNELVVNQLVSAGGSLDRFSLLGELATQFGLALGHSRGALRSAIGYYDKKDGKWHRRQPDPSVYQYVAEPHERGAILVATFFDALIKVYNHKTADLIRIATGGTGILPPGALPQDLAKRLAQEVCEIAGHLQQIAIRALDYCPPVDITFGDFLRALITADMEFSSDEENNYRIALIDAFRSWGVFPQQVNTLSEESLQWSKPELEPEEEQTLRKIARFLKFQVRDLTRFTDRKKIFEVSQVIQGKLHDLLMDESKHPIKKGKYQQWFEKLGLTTKKLEFFDREKGIKYLSRSTVAPHVEVHKVKPAYRVGKQGLILEQVIVTITQSAKFSIKVDGKQIQELKFRGGCTIIFDNSRDFNVSYMIIKRVTNNQRFLDQLAYQQGVSSESASFTESMYDENTGFGQVNFAHLHFH
ncbi:MAG: hypothetical protein JWP45_654 [Mucilaginibacter sp.]|nr:hypothetical protein [Mucilaginibacter sp.]